MNYLESAITNCESALKTGTDVLEAYRKLGNILQASGNFEDATVWHTRSMQPVPDVAEGFVGLGKLYAEQKRWTEAIAAYEQAIAVNPNYAGAYWNLANLYAELGNHSKEIACRQQAMTLFPMWATPENHYSLANRLMSENRLEEAIACYQRVLQFVPDAYEVHYNLAVALTKQQRWEEAIAAFRQALQLNPEHADSYYGLGRLLEQQNNWTEAIHSYQQSLDLNPDAPLVQHALGELLLKQRRWEEAVPICEEVLAHYPESSGAHFNLGYALLKQGQLQQAIEHLRQAVALETTSPWTYYYLTDALLQREFWDEAIVMGLTCLHLQSDVPNLLKLIGRSLRKRLQAGLLQPVPEYLQGTPLPAVEQDPDFYRQLADAFGQHQQWDAAIAFYQLVEQVDPSPTVQQQLAQLVAQQAALAQQIATLQTQIDHNASSPWFYSQLGNLLADLGDIPDAIQLHRQACQLWGWDQSIVYGYQFSQDWFTHNIPQWRYYLEHLAGLPGLRVLEVGSYEGMSACWMLDHWLTDAAAHITCIDLYFQDRFDLNIARTGASAKVTRLQGNSLEILPTLEPNSYQAIYIDGCHLADHVKQEVTLAWPLLEVGGVMIFDDYELKDPKFPGQDPKPAIDACLAEVNDRVELLHKSYQVIVRKTA